MEAFLQYIDDTKLDHFYTQVSRRSDRRAYSLPENQPLRDVIPELINFFRAPHKAGDACLQLIGPDRQRYLDMDCTLKEHQEDFGVRISREDTFLIKTKLSILISLLKDKMEQCAQDGDTRTLRTILKHMPDIIDEDSDFAPELLKQRGLSFLRSLTGRNCYSNFDRRKVTTTVLSVVLKIVSYVDGMLAVYRDRSSVAWLYSQVNACSEARNPDGRNTAIAILYIFVDSELEAEAGVETAPGPHDLAVLFVKCAQEIHLRAGTAPFSEFLDILAEKTAADPETVLAVIQLINKTLETLKDADEMDYFDDLVSALLEQGLNKIMEKQKQGKSAKNKLVQEYNKFVKLLRMEYEEGSGDLDSILKSCMGRRPSYQPGGVGSGSEDNLLALDRKKRSSLSHNPHPSLTDEKSEKNNRSLTPDIRLETTRRSRELEGGRGVGDRLSTPDWKRKDNFTYSPGNTTSTPKVETESSITKQKRTDRWLSAGDSYTPGVYRSLHDSGYQSPAQSPATKSEPSEQIFSPYDRHRKVYYEKIAAESSGEPAPRRHPYSRPAPSAASSPAAKQTESSAKTVFSPVILEARYSTKPTSNEQTASSLESRYSTKPTSNEQTASSLESRYSTKPTVNENNASSLESRYSTKPTSNEQTASSLESRYSTKPTSNENNASFLESRYSTKPTVNEQTASSLDSRYSTKPTVNEQTASSLESRYSTKPTSNENNASSLESRYSTKPTVNEQTASSLESRYSLKTASTSSEENPNSPNPNSVLSVVRSHPYQKKADTLPSPDGPPRKLDSAFSSYTRKSAYSVNKFEYNVNKHVNKSEKSVNKSENSVNTETKNWTKSNASKQDSPSSTPGSKQETENRWMKVETNNLTNNKTETNVNTNSHPNKLESSRSRDRLERRQLPDANQVIRALHEPRSPQSPPRDETPSPSAPSLPSPSAPSAVSKPDTSGQKPRPLVHAYSQAAKESESPAGKLPLTCVRSLKERRIALALSGPDSVSVDVMEQEATPVNVQILSEPSEKTPFPAPGKLAEPANQETEPAQKEESGQDTSEPPVPPPAPSQPGVRLGMLETGCDLAPSSLLSEWTDVFILPFSPELRLEPSELRMPELPATQTPEIKPKSHTLPSSKSSPSASAPNSPTEESPLAKQLILRKQESESKLSLIPLPEVNLARHELTFGQIEFRLLDSQYDRDPYQANGAKKSRHVPGEIPAPPPDIPRPREIPAPPADLPEVRGSGAPSKLSAIRFRWKLLGLGAGRGKERGEKRDIWSELRRVVAPSDVIRAFVSAPTATPPPSKTSKSKETTVEILQMKRRTSLGVTLKCLQKFKMGEEDNNFRKLRGYLETLDLEVLNEEIIEVLEKDVLTKAFGKELEDIRRAKQEALSQGNRIKLRDEEKFLLALGEVESLNERIRIATFCLRFHEKEEEVAKKLMVLMGAAAEIKESHTFKFVLSTLLSIGNAVEQREAGGFDLEFLERAESYKDACHKKDLIHHAAAYVMEHFPSSSNLFSDFPNVQDGWRMELEFSDLKAEIMSEQQKWSQCKASLDRLKLPNRDSFNQKLEQFGLKINKFYITLGRMENYYRDLYLYLGYDKYLADSQKLFTFLKILRNFSLVYKSHHERIIQIREKMEQEKRRERTRGKKLPIAENIQVKIVEPEAEGARSGAEDEGAVVASNVISAVIAQRSREGKKPKTGVRYREKKAHGNRREKRTSIRRTLNEEDGLIDKAKKELETEKNGQETSAN